MIAIGMRYLTKYAVATNQARQRAEWPPHFGRVFMAMAAAHVENGSDAGERIALEWLEAAEPPAMLASDAEERSLVRAYVPVNDEHDGILKRARQERSFPRIRPHEDCVYFIWNATPSPATRAALGTVCGKVTRVGHSSSAVQMWAVESGQEPVPNWWPDAPFEDIRVRVTGPGTMQALEEACNLVPIQQYDNVAEALSAANGREKTALKREIEARFPQGRPESRRPQLVRWQGYGRAKGLEKSEQAAAGPFDENLIVLTKREGSALGLESTLQLTGAMRISAMKAAGESVPEWISGHDKTGAPSQRPHLAFFPLPYVGYEHSDGHVMGLGIAVPREMAASDALRRSLGPLFFDPETGDEHEIHLWRNRFGGGDSVVRCTRVWDWTLEREKRERPPIALRLSTWTNPSRVWASVTPVVLHHYPKKRNGDVERIVREAFVSALYPEPEWVATTSISRVFGSGHALEVPPFTEGGTNLCRYQTHVVARFAVPVRGPVLVGRGRYRGYGLFRPISEQEAGIE
jgi:CRISPR-associated protein Csb2